MIFGLSFVELIGQIIGLVAFFISIWGLNKTDDKAMKIYVSIAFTFFALQFYLIGAYMGAFLCVLGGIRYFIAGYTKNIFTMIGFIALYFGLAIYNFDRPIDLFLIAGHTIGTIAIFRLEKEKMRYFFLCSSSSNLIYHFYYLALGSIINEILNILIHLNVIRKLKKLSKG